MADLTICGAGIFGLSIAWEALNRGAKVAVIDPGGPGAGASGGIVGALQPHTPDPWNAKKQFQLESLNAHEAFWKGVEAVSGISAGYARVGRLQPLKTQQDVERAVARTTAAEIHWGKVAKWSVISKAPDDGWHPPSPTGHFVHDTLSAILNPRRAIESLAAAIQTRGGNFVHDAPATAPVVWATGWQGLRDIQRDLGVQVGNGVKGQAILLDHNASGAPQIFADGLHIIPHLDGTVAVGSTSERDFVDPRTTDNQLDDLHARATELLPILHGAPVRARWAGVRPRATTRAPLLGPWPGKSGHFIANGGFKIGFGMAPRCASKMVDLVLEGVDDIPSEFHTNSLISG